MICYTTAGQPFEIDALDLPIIKEFSCVIKTSQGYIAVKRPGEKRYQKIHRLIMLATDQCIVDHRDRDRANNKRGNLRVATKAQNNCNLSKQKKDNHTSEFKGVSWHKGSKKWRSRVYHGGKCFFLGFFECPVKAAEAYDVAANDKHGPFASLNFTYPTFQEEMDRAR